MFNFLKWQAWISAKADLLRDAGREVQFREAGQEQKPSFIIGLIGEKTLADFATWNTGETDWTVMAKANGSGTTPLAHRWGIILNDDDYENAFAEFMAAVSKFEPETQRINQDIANLFRRAP